MNALAVSCGRYNGVIPSRPKRFMILRRMQARTGNIRIMHGGLDFLILIMESFSLCFNVAVIVGKVILEAVVWTFSVLDLIFDIDKISVT